MVVAGSGTTGEYEGVKSTHANTGEKGLRAGAKETPGESFPIPLLVEC